MYRPPANESPILTAWYPPFLYESIPSSSSSDAEDDEQQPDMIVAANANHRFSINNKAIEYPSPEIFWIANPIQI